MCKLSTDLTGSVLFPVIALVFLAGVGVLVWNNVQNDRPFHKVQLVAMEQLSSLDKRRTILGIGLIVGSFLVQVAHVGITTAFVNLASFAGWCDRDAPGAALWPPTVMFLMFAIVSWVAVGLGRLTEPLRGATKSAAWAFLSLAVGFGVAVFWTDPAVLVWPPVAAALLPIGVTLLGGKVANNAAVDPLLGEDDDPDAADGRIAAP